MPRFQREQEGGAPYYDPLAMRKYGVSTPVLRAPFDSLPPAIRNRIQHAEVVPGCAVVDHEAPWAGGDATLGLGAILLESDPTVSRGLRILSGARDLDGRVAHRARRTAGVKALEVTIVAPDAPTWAKLAMGLAMKRAQARRGRPSPELDILRREGYAAAVRLLAEHSDVIPTQRVATARVREFAVNALLDHTYFHRANGYHRNGLDKTVRAVCPEHGPIVTDPSLPVAVRDWGVKASERRRTSGITQSRRVARL